MTKLKDHYHGPYFHLNRMNRLNPLNQGLNSQAVHQLEFVHLNERDLSNQYEERKVKNWVLIGLYLKNL